MSGGGALILVPFVIKEHQIPHDFFRYTSFALKKLANDAGFSVLSISGIGGLGNIKATIGRLENKYLTSWKQRILLKAEDFILRIRVNEYGDIHAPELPQGWVAILKKE